MTGSHEARGSSPLSSTNKFKKAEFREVPGFGFFIFYRKADVR